MVSRRTFPGKTVAIMAFVASLLLASSCRRTDYAVGDEIGFKEVLDVYLKVLKVADDKSYVLKQDMVDLLVSEPEWFVSPGIEIMEKSIEAKAWPVVWHEGSTTYSAKGMRLWVKGKVKVQRDCPKGRHQLYLLLPHLQALTSEIEAVPMIVSNQGGRLARSLPRFVHQPAPQVSGIYVLTVRYFNIYENTRSSRWAHFKVVMFSLGFIAVVVFVLIVLDPR